MKIRLTHIDGKLPNLALMKLAHWYKARGAEVYLQRTVRPTLDEPVYNNVYGSSIFVFSAFKRVILKAFYPLAVVGGTGAPNLLTVEQLLGVDRYEFCDYSIYPDFNYSMGFTSRGCRMKCPFCLVPEREGKIQPVNTVQEIYRYNGVRNIILLDNDFFGQPLLHWIKNVKFLIRENFKVCLNQGINVRLISDEQAYWLSNLRYYDTTFRYRRIYTAWDNLKDEKAVMAGLQRLFDVGIPPRHVMVYFLIGFDPDESWEDILYRLKRLQELNVMPYPMLYDPKDPALRWFQRYVVRRYYQCVPWNEFTKEKCAALNHERYMRNK